MTATVAPAKKDTYTPLELFDIDRLLDEDERDIAATVRRFVDTRLRPHIADWFESSTLPKELAKEFGSLGVMGMHLEGYGCAGTNAVSYGLACMELEAGDSGFRSFVSVQGSLSMFSIHHFGSEEQKQQWLPRLASGDAIGCFGLVQAKAQHHGRAQDGGQGVGHALASDVGRAAVAGFVQALVFAVQ